jgi:hypothetical protein
MDNEVMDNNAIKGKPLLAVAITSLRLGETSPTNRWLQG